MIFGKEAAQEAGGIASLAAAHCFIDSWTYGDGKGLRIVRNAPAKNIIDKQSNIKVSKGSVLGRYRRNDESLKEGRLC